MAKLVLDIEPEILKQAEDFANERHVDLSALVSDYLNRISVPNQSVDRVENTDITKNSDPLVEKYKNIEIPTWIKELTGVAKIHDDISYDDLKYQYFIERYDL